MQGKEFSKKNMNGLSYFNHTQRIGIGVIIHNTLIFITVLIIILVFEKSVSKSLRPDFRPLSCYTLPSRPYKRKDLV